MGASVGSGRKERHVRQEHNGKARLHLALSPPDRTTSSPTVQRQLVNDDTLCSNDSAWHGRAHPMMQRIGQRAGLGGRPTARQGAVSAAAFASSVQELPSTSSKATSR